MPKTYTVTLTLPNGTRKYYRGKTKREAEAKRDADKNNISLGLAVGLNPSVSEVAEQWFERYTGRKNLHVRSEETIRGILDRQIVPRIGSIGIKDLKPMHIDKLLEDTKGLSASTQKKTLSYTKLIVNFAIDNDLILKSPIKSEHTISAKPPEDVVPLTDAQCETLLAATANTRVYPFIMVCLYCGLRKGEALGLMWKDIDFENHDLYVRRSIVYTSENHNGIINTDLKTENAERRIPMPRVLEEELLKQKAKSKSLYVFSMANGNFLSESSFRRMWDIIKYRSTSTDSDKAFIERTIDFDVHPHLLRHTCITRWIEKGLDVTDAQRMAGHATPEITMRIYNHFRDEARYEQVRERICGEV